MFSKKNKLLVKLYYYQEIQQQSVVKGATLEEVLKINYKTLHELAKKWEEKGCLVSRSERGGMMEYQLTSLGMIAVKRITKMEKQLQMTLILIAFAAAIFYFT